MNEREVEVLEADSRKPVVLVSEFGQWLRKVLLFLLIVSIGLSTYAMYLIGQVAHLVDTNSAQRGRQNCALLRAAPQTPEVVLVIEETC